MAAETERGIVRFVRVVRTSLGLVWSADPARFGASATLQLAIGVASARQLLAISGATAAVLDAAGRGAGLGATLRAVAGAAALTAFLGASRVLRTIAEETVLNIKVARIVDSRILDVATAVDLESFDDPAFFDRLQRASTNAMSRPGMMVRGLLGLVGGLLGIGGVAWGLAVLQPWLVPFVAIAGVPLWVLGVRTAQEGFRSSVRLASGSRQRAYLRRVLTGREEAKEVRAFGLAPLLRRHYDARYDEWITERRRLLRRGTVRQLVGQATSATVMGSTLVLLLWMVSRGRMSLGAATAAAYGVQRLRGQVTGVIYSIVQLYECSLFLDDLESFLALGPEIEGSRPTGVVPGPFTSLVVDDVSFTYPGASGHALRDVSLEVGAGEVVALVGENGSGKTTLAKLLCHLYRPSDGRILWDGIDTSGCDPRSARDHVAVIFQDFVRYELSARDNVAVGRPERGEDLEAIVASAVASGAHADLAPLPAGYDTFLGRTMEGGRDLSGGQWQRVALARAFFRDASFIVLDEPTAALDPRAEHALFQTVRTLCAGRSVLLISHRFSTVREADRIYVLREGAIVEHGSHDELMRTDGLYAELFTLQASSYAQRAPA